MAAKESSRTTRRAAATRQAIVEAAEALAGGPAAVTIEAVAELADIAVQTVYNRVGGRAAILIAVAERAFEENRVYMDSAYATPGTPRERIPPAAEAYMCHQCPAVLYLGRPSGAAREAGTLVVTLLGGDRLTSDATSCPCTQSLGLQHGRPANTPAQPS